MGQVIEIRAASRAGQHEALRQYRAVRRLSLPPLQAMHRVLEEAGEVLHHHQLSDAQRLFAEQLAGWAVKYGAMVLYRSKRRPYWDRGRQANA
jgi:hypothetical protein